MENVRFRIIENDMKWEVPMDSNDQDDNRSISSESSGDAILSDETHNIFHRTQKFMVLWEPEEIENSFKSLANFENILKMVTLRNFTDLISGSNDVNIALLMSAFYGCARNVYDLLENFLADTNFVDAKGRTALHFSCCIGEFQIAKILLDHGADPNRWDRENRATPLHCAASAGSVECILLLLKRKAHINMGIEKRSALHFAIDKDAIDCVETLLKYGADPNTPQVFTETPLHTAAALGRKECLKLLLEYGADARSQFGERKLTALHLAAEDDYFECVQILLEHGAEVDCKNVDQQTPLHVACLGQCVETIEILLKYGADVNAVYRDGRTTLHAALVKQTRSLECIRILLIAGAQVNRADDYGYTPLHLSALNEFSSSVYCLIENGADITARTKGGISALSFIVRRTPEIIPKLITKLDSSIKVNEHEIGDVDCEIKLDFRLLVPNKERGETELLLSFVEVGQKRILKHPLCETFLFLKWRRIRKFFLMTLSYQSTYVLMFTLYVMGIYVTHCEENKPCRSSGYATPVGFFVVILNFTLLLCEFYEMSHGIYAYARYWENWLQWTIILGVFLCATPGTVLRQDLFEVPNWQHHVAAIVVFLVWLELMMMVGRFPIFGLYVQMFTKVAVNFGKFLLAYCCLIIAFALSFCVLFKNYKAFGSIPTAMLKAITMMAGELEFEDIFYSDEIPVPYPVTSHIVFFIFVLLVTIILTNLLVGLAVSDIQGLQASAGLDRLTRQAELVSRLESLFFSRIIRKVPPRIRRFFQRSALLRTSRYQLQFMTRPNDPRDKQLPEEIKLNIYKLVAERRDRNQSLRRKRREYNYDFFNRSIDRQQKIDATTMRPRSVTATGRNRIVSENFSNNDKILRPGSNPLLNPGVTISGVTEIPNEGANSTNNQKEFQLLLVKMDKLNETVLKRFQIINEELTRLKMQLDRRRPF